MLLNNYTRELSTCIEMVVYVSVIDIEKRMEERIVIMCVLLIEASYLFLSVISQFTIKGTTDVLNYIIQFIL